MPERTFGSEIEWHHCCWPKCPKPSYGPHVPLCELHGRSAYTHVAHDLIHRDETEYDEFKRVTREMTLRRRMARERTSKEVRDGHIYYLRMGELIKIGYASNILRRLRDYPPSAVLLAYHKGTLKDEAELHQRFAAHRSAGREWYEPTDELKAHISQVRRRFGPPDTAVLMPKRQHTRRRTA